MIRLGNALKSTLLMVLMILILPLSIYAAPLITSAPASGTHGQIIIVKGSGFGIKSPVAPAKYDPVEGSYTGLSDGNTIPVGSGRMWNVINGSEGWPPVYSTANYRGKLRASYSNKGRLSGDGVGNVGSYTVPNCSGGKMYVSWWIYPRSNMSVSGSNKLFRFGDNVMGADSITFVLQTTGQYDVYDGTYLVNNWNGPSWGSGVLNKWNRLEVLADNSTTPNNPSIKIWQNNAQYGSAAAAGNNPSICTVMALGADFSNASGRQPQIEFGEIYVDNTLARVEICDASTTKASSTHCEIQIPTTQWIDGQLQVVVNQGSFADNSTAYLYVIDASGNASNPSTITFGSVGSIDNPPSITIASPTSGGTYSTTQNTVSLSGTASDDHGISSITWINSAGGNGTATNVSGSWSVSNVSLQLGQNVITITATDTVGQSSTTTLTVTYTTTPVILSTLSWDALQQTGDTAWKNSGVTYCVRLLVQGNAITKSAGKVRLGFQGRSSGSYTISRVSIAERDLAAVEGNVVATTWTKVTFDGRNESTWATDIVTVPAIAEKLSDEIPFSVSPTKDYYVTFKINSPSVYLNPQSGYRELYFEVADHTQDIQWAGTGFLTTQDYHALSGIYYAGPATPQFKSIVGHQ
jgi:hypothetical protein